MAIVENPYHTAKPLDPMFTVGRVLRTVQAQIAITASSANNDVVILAKGVPPAARVARIMLPKGTAALTGCTVDIGLYKMSKGLNDNAETEYTAVDEDALVDGQSFAEALGHIDIVGANISSFDATNDFATLDGSTSDAFPADGSAIGAHLVDIGLVYGI